MHGELTKSLARRTTGLTVAVLATSWCLMTLGARAEVPAPHNTLTIKNESGDPVHAELVGPSAQVVELPDGGSRTVNVAPGEYTMQIRYGTDPNTYSYSKVAPFVVRQTETTFMAATVRIECNAPRFPEPVP